MIKIGCQTIVFGNPTIKDNLAKYAEIVKKTGYDGVEIGSRHFDQSKPEYYKDVFTKLDLNLIALHIGGDFLNKDSVKDQIDNMKKTIQFGKALGCHYIFTSGIYKDGKTVDEYLTEAGYLREIGKVCNDEGLVFCYHNHSWEFFNGGIGMKTLLSNVPATLMKLVPDIGWLERSGVSAIKFLKENIDRVEVLHFKDYATYDGPPVGYIETPELGTGIVPFNEVYSYVTGLGRDWWIIAEQDETKIDPKDAVRINYEFIKKLGK